MGQKQKREKDARKPAGPKIPLLLQTIACNGTLYQEKSQQGQGAFRPLPEHLGSQFSACNLILT